MTNHRKKIKLLAISDIHNNIKCIEQLCEEAGETYFYAIIVADDIGDDNATDLFRILRLTLTALYSTYMAIWIIN